MKIRRIDFYPDDWLAGTLELNEFDRGVYITICALIYSRGGSITEKVLQSYCKGHPNAIKPSLARLHEAGKITRLGGVLGQTRARRELDRAETRLRQSRDAGAKGGRPKGLAKPDGYISEKPNNQQPEDRDLVPTNSPSSSNGITRHSVPNGTGADAPAQPTDPAKEMWDRGKRLLGQSAGSLIGQALKRYKQLAVMEAIIATEDANTPDPISYFIATLKGRAYARNAHAAETAAFEFISRTAADC